LAEAVCQTRNITKKHCEERSDEAAVKQTIKKLALHNKDEIITRGATFFELCLTTQLHSHGHPIIDNRSSLVTVRPSGQLVR
jgi:hypothetical protein